MKTNHVSLAEPEARHEIQKSTPFDLNAVIHDLKHYLPEQAALKDFIHQNTLHAFQSYKFFDGLRYASQILGYKVSLSLAEYRQLFSSGRISEAVLRKILAEQVGADQVSNWMEKLLRQNFEALPPPRIGLLRSNWKRNYKIDLNSLVHPILFRILCSYLDQGIAIWNFPVKELTFLQSIRELEKNTFSSFFKSKRARQFLLLENDRIEPLLKILVGDSSLYQQYLFDQQFAHQGWSGIVSVIEDQPSTLLDTRNISLHDLLVFELLLEIDALDTHFPEGWQPLADRMIVKPVELFEPVFETELHQVLKIWQEAFEWTYYDEVLFGMTLGNPLEPRVEKKTFQAMFCIDDRECSFRRHLESTDPACETFATPGFFGVEFYFQPEGGKFYTKVCPAPMTPKYLIKEFENKEKRQTDVHFSKHTHNFYSGWLISQTIGFWSAIKLFLNIFRPSADAGMSFSFQHMDKHSSLTIQNTGAEAVENGLQIGFTIPEMAQRLEGLLMSIGLVKDFSPIVYLIGHGSSSINNPHYAAYDCGACSGRPGSVNARAASFMANHREVRQILSQKGIVIPEETQFIGGLHDTTRDEVMFFDEQELSPANQKIHLENEKTFKTALDLNAKERSRRFVSTSTHGSPLAVHIEILKRSVSLFEPRPELNHATNALCVVGRRSLTKKLFLDRRAFMNSYDYRIDPDGKYLLNIMRPAAPVCGGINLEYFFSRVDNQKLGAGTKLPHNVMGLFGVANGIDGDLRPGLPSQMIEVHDPVRLLIIIEHFPNVILETLQKSPETFAWFTNEWIHLVAANPETFELSVFRNEGFMPYVPVTQHIRKVTDFTPVFEGSQENLPVYEIN